MKKIGSFRRRFAPLLPSLLLCLAAAGCRFGGPAETEKGCSMTRFAYAGANRRTAEGGIRILAPEGGRLAEVGRVPLKGPFYFTRTPDGRRFYAVANGEKMQGFLAAFEVVDGGAALRKLGEAPTGGGDSCHLTLDPDARFCYTANYRNGTVTEFRLRPDGAPDAAARRIVADRGTPGPDPKRQMRAHAHQTVFTPDGRYLCVVDLGLDAILLYPFSPEKGIADEPASVFRADPGQGPRHLVFAADGRRAWCVNELGNTITALHYADGRLERRGQYSTLPADFTGASFAAALRLSPDERFLVATNRGHNSAAVFPIAPDGTPEPAVWFDVRGDWPRDFNFLPGGRTAAVCCEKSSHLTLFRYDAASGALEYLDGADLPIPGVLCIY